MAKEETNTPVLGSLKPAKRNKILQDISKQLQGCQISDTVEIAGHQFYMTTLTPDEEVWADSFIIPRNVAVISSRRVPRLAASIKRIDGQSIAELFEFSDSMSEEDKAFVNDSHINKRYWQMGQLAIWLAGDSEENDSHMPFIDDLWDVYVTIVANRDESWGALKKSFARTTSGESERTSSQEKESLPATPM